MMKDFEINKVIVEKRHISDSTNTSQKILEMLNGLMEEKQDGEGIKKEGFDGWITKDEFGNTSPLVQGKRQSIKFENVRMVYRLQSTSI